jgi:WD40 repeat protein
VVWIDNAAVKFDPEGKYLAFSGSSLTAGRAKVWEIASGAEVASWSFDPGLENLLVFRKPNHWLLFQVELEQGEALPDSAYHPKDFPKVGRVYQLQPGQAPRLRFAIPEFPWHMEFPVALADGRLLAVAGHYGRERRTGGSVKVYDLETGREVWVLPPAPHHRHVLTGDRSGRNLNVARQTDDGVTTITYPFDFDPAAGKVSTGPAQSYGHAMFGWNPAMPYQIDDRDSVRLSLTPGPGHEPVLWLDREQRNSGIQLQFSRDGRLFAWGNEDGTVNVCDIQEARRRLTEIGLGW